MIIRCKSCVSAFAVDDEKVADRKFAFTCPKCGIENIIDNRRLAKSADFDEPVSDDLFDEVPGPAAPAAAKKSEDDFAVFDEEMPEEKSAPSKKQAINLELEEASPESSDKDFTFDDEILFDETESPEKPAKKPAPVSESSDDLFMDELDIEIGDDAEKSGKEMPEPDFAEMELDSELDGFDDGMSAKTSAASSDRDKKITEQDEIDAMFAASSAGSGSKKDADVTVDLDSLDIDFDEQPAAGGKKSGPVEDFGTDDVVFFDDEGAVKKPGAKRPEEDMTALEIDTLDLLEEPEVQPGKKPGAAAAEEDITIDIDSLDIDIEEPEAAPAAAKKVPADEDSLFDLEIPAEAAPAKKAAVKEEPLFDFDITDDESEKFESSGGKGEELIFDEDEIASGTGKPAAPGKKSLEQDEDITIDIDSLDIDIEEPVHASMKALPEHKAAAAQADDSITLDIDSLDIDIEEPAFDSRPSKGELSEEDIEIDLDSLEFDTEETRPAAPARSKNVREIMKEQAEQGEDEDIKLNLDELDIDIDEISEKDMDFVKKGKAPSGRKAIIEEAPEDEDESITIDLDTLDIEVAENAPLIDSEISEEDEKLTLEDAGITFDELTTSEKKQMHLDLGDEEDIKLTLDEVDPDMRLEQIGEEASPDEPLLIDTVDELPEINLDDLDDQPVAKSGRGYRRIVPEEDLDLEIEPSLMPKHTARSARSAGEAGYHARGTTVFTVDFSLKYSRIGALLRLLQLYTISMIPHFIVLYIYTVLSGILGFINQLVILSTGRCVEDFAQIAENTLRYYLYIETCITGIVEDRPEFAGRERIDHQMQLNLTYPLKYSKLLAALRLSVLGIFLVTLPHLVILWFITLFVPVVYLAGIIWVIITGRWPNPLFMLLTMYFRYMARISAFMIGLTDHYPGFRLQ